MSIATALVTGDDPLPQLAEEATAQALSRAGLTHAEGVLLFLSPDFARHTPAAVLAASRVSNCLQVFGSVVAGLATERSWVFDRPAAAAMVFGGNYTLASPDDRHGGTRLVMAGASSLPPAWAEAPASLGIVYSDPLMTRPTPAWSHARASATNRAEVVIGGAQAHIGVSTGVKVLGGELSVKAVNGHDLWQLGMHSAVAALRQALPAEYRTGLPLPLHLLALQVVEADEPQPEADSPRPPPRLIPLVASNADGSLTIGEPLHVGQKILWTIRQPVAAEADMQAIAADLLGRCHGQPAFGLFFSCIGRGPYFYGGEDRDWLAMRAAMPGVPLLGVYGSGQIAPYGQANHLLQNTVVLSLFTPQVPQEPRQD